MTEKQYDIVIIGSGAGGGTVALAVAPLVRAGKKVLVVEQGARFSDAEMTGGELEMTQALYEDGGGVLNIEGTLTLAYGKAYGGTTVVYTGTSLPPPKRVIDAWSVPGLSHADLEKRVQRYSEQNNVHLLSDDLLNDNNKLFRFGGQRAGFHVEQFPLNLKACQGSSLCNLGCPNGAKQGTHKVQLPLAEKAGVEVVTRAEVARIDPQDHSLHVHVSEKAAGEKGAESEWPAGNYHIAAQLIVLAGGSLGSSALLLRSGFGAQLKRLGQGFTCHPVQILVGQHEKPITNDVGHPKSFFIDRAQDEGFFLETCMYPPFVTAKNMAGFGEEHWQFMREFSHLQMIIALVCDHTHPDNYISIDRRGKPAVHYTLQPETIKSLVAGSRASAKIFFAAGARCVHVPCAEPTLLKTIDLDRIDERISEKYFQAGRISVSAAHLMGGCGMGNDAGDSVTDSWGRVHGVPWLRIADSSLFPNSLEINPYLTIMSLADRVTENILAEAGSLLA